MAVHAASFALRAPRPHGCSCHVLAGGDSAAIPNVTSALIEVLFEGGRDREARALLMRLPGSMAGEDAVTAAMLARRFKEEPAAHRYFGQAGAALDTHPRALHEYAQTKIWLTGQATRA